MTYDHPIVFEPTRRRKFWFRVRCWFAGLFRKRVTYVYPDNTPVFVPKVTRIEV